MIVKKARQILITGLISIMIANIFFIPNHAQASEEISNVQNNLIQSIQSLEKDLREFGQQQIMITQSALELLKQPDISIKNYKNLTILQNSLKSNARNWLDGIKPQNIQVVQNVISFNNVVNSFYEPLVTLSRKANDDPESKKQLISGLTLILDEVKLIQNHTNTTLLNTKFANASINRKHTEFSNAVSKARGELTNGGSRLQALKSELDELKEERVDLIFSLSGATVGAVGAGLSLVLVAATVSGPGFLILGLIGGLAVLIGSTTALVVLSKQLHEKNKDIASKAKKIAQINSDVSVLDITVISMDQFANKVDETPIQNVNNTLNSIKDELQNTITQIQVTKSINSDFLVNLFTQLRDSMNQVSNQAETIHSYNQLPVIKVDLDKELYDQIK
ncbi:HBL/NHE enterotoxin family protein [Chengkuizengella sediminis]|uniref:HBL/NHE enterotoxin family protein n=1 Tax=Chengkuizengella sediminis TaxID=1885917 RepID=UPI001389B684|nr:HBL/NHE enterotoxin family protein [Chengkuizengella sediminis]NDI33207.1 alpha-helical pore-forming toxin family protein [Chengkuizengella sediminis]